MENFVALVGMACLASAIAYAQTAAFMCEKVLGMSERRSGQVAAQLTGGNENVEAEERAPNPQLAAREPAS